jgi:tetratricopeptide (TPR) repeat protein
MLKRILIATLLLYTAIELTAYARVLGNEASQTLVDEGNVLLAKRQYRDAVNKYLEASKKDPTASIPLSSLAHALLEASRATEAEAAAKLRQQSEAAARQALSLGPNDPLAQEVLRNLLDDTPPPLHPPTPEAWRLMGEGEILFQSHHYTDALKKYEQAAQLDPLYSEAWVFAGDCFFMQKNWPEAELRFRKATEIEPLKAQAWRYLADALAAQGKKADAENALINSIAAQPSQLPSWEKLAQRRAASGLPMKSLHLTRKVQPSTDPATGKSTLTIDPEFFNEADKGDKTADMGAWLAYAATESNGKAAGSKDGTALSPFQIELDAWRDALKVAAELEKNTGKPLSDPALVTMQKLAQENQLEPAILLLLYKESYRPELEAWKNSHPNGVKTFIDAHGLRP